MRICMRGLAKMEVYYWKKIDWLLFFSDNRMAGELDAIRFPKRTFEHDWVKLPVTFRDTSIDEIFNELNSDDNPLSTPYHQMWLKENGLTHTSASVGDIFKRGDKYFVCLNLGWGRLDFIEETDEA